MNTNQREC